MLASRSNDPAFSRLRLEVLEPRTAPAILSGAGLGADVGLHLPGLDVTADAGLALGPAGDVSVEAGAGLQLLPLGSAEEPALATLAVEAAAALGTDGEPLLAAAAGADATLAETDATLRLDAGVGASATTLEASADLSVAPGAPPLSADLEASVEVGPVAAEVQAGVQAGESSGGGSLPAPPGPGVIVDVGGEVSIGTPGETGGVGAGVGVGGEISTGTPGGTVGGDVGAGATFGVPGSDGAVGSVPVGIDPRVAVPDLAGAPPVAADGGTSLAARPADFAPSGSEAPADTDAEAPPDAPADDAGPAMLQALLTLFQTFLTGGVGELTGAEPSVEGAGAAADAPPVATEPAAFQPGFAGDDAPNAEPEGAGLVTEFVPAGAADRFFAALAGGTDGLGDVLAQWLAGWHWATLALVGSAAVAHQVRRRRPRRGVTPVPAGGP